MGVHAIDCLLPHTWLGVMQTRGNKPHIRNLYPGHEEESIERLKIVNSMKEKIQQDFGVWLLFFSRNTFKRISLTAAGANCQDYAKKTKQIETQARNWFQAVAKTNVLEFEKLNLGKTSLQFQEM